jgi:hypothetical protein
VPVVRQGQVYLNIKTGQWHCKTCDAKGNHIIFLTRLHEEMLKETTDDQYHALKEKRGIPLQTLKRHGLTFDPSDGCWLIPFKSKQGSVVNIQRYYPDREKPNKFNLPELLTSLSSAWIVSRRTKASPCCCVRGL